MSDYLVSGFVHQHALELTPVSGEVIIAGHIACLGKIVISVWKILSVLEDGGSDDDPRVQTRHYAYNAFVAGYGSFLRHDNAPHPGLGGTDHHHIHEMDWRTEAEAPGSPKWCGEEGWVNLSQFIDKVHSWYDAHREELPEPHAVIDDLSVYDRYSLGEC